MFLMGRGDVITLAPRLTFPPLSAIESPHSPCFYTFSTQVYGLTTKTYKLYASRSSPAVESPLSPCFYNPSILLEGDPATPNGAVLSKAWELLSEITIPYKSR